MRVRFLTLTLIVTILLLTQPIRAQQNNVGQDIASDEEVLVDINLPSTSKIPSSASSSSHDPSLPPFEPTHEWQPILPGQAVPPGLWIRMDINTGQRMARLMPEEEMTDGDKRLAAQRAEAAALALVEQAEEEKAAESTQDGPAIRHLPAGGKEADGLLDSLAPSNDEALQFARRERLRQLKEHFYLKEDVEQMKQLLNICIDPSSSVDDVLRALESLEEYLHQIDNANDWAKIGGLDVALALLQQENEVETEPPSNEVIQPIIPSSPDLNTTADHPPTLPAPLDLQASRLYRLQANAAWVLGTAAQNNPFVQDAALREGAIQVLVRGYERLMREELQDYPKSYQAVTYVQLRSARLKLLAKILYALSAILRNNARGQQLFEQLNGAQLLLIHLDPASWKRCNPTPSSSATGSNASPVGCLNPNEYVQLLKLGDSIHSKRMNLLHDFIIDHVINSLESVGGDGRVHQAQVGMSDPKLFDTLTTEPFCQEYIDMVLQPGANKIEIQTQPSSESSSLSNPYSPTQLSTREMSLAIMKSLMHHQSHPTMSNGLCRSYYQTHRRELVDSLDRLSDFHRRLSELTTRQAAVATEDDDSGKYHMELSQSIEQVRLLIES